ncbi:hypothetical protein D3C75_1280700 [compost metagenome]
MRVNQRVTGRQRFEFIRRGNERLLSDFSQLFRHAHGIFRVRVQPGSDSRSA